MFEMISSGLIPVWAIRIALEVIDGIIKHNIREPALELNPVDKYKPARSLTD
jgi:hypothetical protein